MPPTPERSDDTVPPALRDALEASEAAWFEATRVYVVACRGVLDDRMERLASLVPGHEVSMEGYAEDPPRIVVEPPYHGRDTFAPNDPLATSDDPPPDAHAIDAAVEIAVGVGYKMILAGTVPNPGPRTVPAGPTLR